MLDESSPITDDELLYRFFLEKYGWYDPRDKLPPHKDAFRPREHDVTGISLFRAAFYAKPKDALPENGKSYYIAVLRASGIRSLGLDIIPKPDDEGRMGHVEIPQLTYATRKSDASEVWQRALSLNCIEIIGPFSRPAP